METLLVIVAASVAAVSLAGVYALWGHVHRLRHELLQRTKGGENRLDRIDARLQALEHEVTRQSIELEEQGIKLETRAYWDD